MFKYKENLNDYFLTGQIHLSKKDYGFFSNLRYLIKDTNQITTNQTKLFDKLIGKYKRQLDKQGYKVEDLINLFWKVEVVESKKEYLEARLFTDRNMICFKLPFNNQFIKYFRQLNNNTFEWDKTHKRYQSQYSTYALKLALNSLQKFYKDISFDSAINDILTEVNQFNTSTVWKPKLVKSNDNYYIAALNETLFNNIKHLNLCDDPTILFQLSRYGVEIDEEIIQSDNFKKFASSFYVTVDLDDLSKALMYLQLLDIKQVTLTSEVIYTKEISKEVKEKIKEFGIECYPPYINMDNANENVLLQYSRNAYSVKKTKNILKCITLTNSRPVNVR